MLENTFFNFFQQSAFFEMSPSICHAHRKQLCGVIGKGKSCECDFIGQNDVSLAVFNSKISL